MATTSGEQARPKIVSENRLEVFKFDQQITFDKFSARHHHHNVDTDNFVPPLKCGPKYFLRLKPRTDESGLNGYERPGCSGILLVSNREYYYICLQLHLATSTKKNTKIEGTTYVLDRNGTKRISHEINAYHRQGHSNPVIFLKKLTEVMGVDNELLPDDKLTFYCEFTFTIETTVARTVTDQLMERFDEFGQINEDFCRLLIDGKLTDVQLVVGGKDFQAHKCILAARSPVFGAMFEHDTKEKQQNRVEITDVEWDVFAEVLRYIYTGKIGSLDKFGAELLVVADKYQLDSLKALCEVSLCGQLSHKTVADLIVLADQHSAHKLKQVALEYFQKNTQESIESLFETNKSEALVKAFRDLTCRDGSAE